MWTSSQYRMHDSRRRLMTQAWCAALASTAPAQRNLSYCAGIAVHDLLSAWKEPPLSAEQQACIVCSALMRLSCE